MKRRLLILFAVLVVAGCASEQKFRQALNTWIGATETQLVTRLGPPDRVYESPDHNTRILTYENTDVVSYPGTPPTYIHRRFGNTIYSEPFGGFPPEVVRYHCEVNFIINKKGVVTAWRYEGNSCAI